MVSDIEADDSSEESNVGFGDVLTEQEGLIPTQMLFQAIQRFEQRV